MNRKEHLLLCIKETPSIFNEISSAATGVYSPFYLQALHNMYQNIDDPDYKRDLYKDIVELIEQLEI